MKKIFFIVNYSTAIGYGHLKRCLVMAEYLYKDFEIFFLRSPNFFKNQFKNFKLFSINKLDYKMLSTNDIIVIDIIESVLLKKKYKNVIKKFKKFCNIILIDNNFKKKWNLKYKIFPYLNFNKTSSRYCGQNYFIFDKKIINLVKKKDNKIKSNIVICMGGSDRYNLTYKVANELIASHINCKINLIIGPLYSSPKLQKINEVKKRNSNVEIHKNPKKVYEIIRNNKLAIINSGNLKYECALLGTPFVLYANTTKDIKSSINFSKKFKVFFQNNFVFKKKDLRSVIKEIYTDELNLKLYKKYNIKQFNLTKINKTIQLIKKIGNV